MARKNKKRMKAIDKAMVILLLVGGLAWGINAWFAFNIVEWITFGVGWLAKTIYTLVGLSAVVGAYRLLR